MAKHGQEFNLREAEKIFAFSQSVKSGNMLFISGTLSWDENAEPLGVGDMSTQVQNVYEELLKTLKANGADFSNVVKETVFTRDMEALVEAAPVRAAFFKDCAPPAATNPELLVEIEMTAVLD